jgi:hypothetical protein
MRHEVRKMPAISKVFAVALLLAPWHAGTHAASKTMDTIADWLAIFVIVVVPIAAVAAVLVCRSVVN